MNKYNKGLLVAALCSIASNGLIASQAKARPFFDESTQKTLEKTAKRYAYGYMGIYGAGTGLAVVGTFVATPLMAMFSLVTKDAKVLGEALNPFATARELNRGIYRQIHRSHFLAAPCVFGTSLVYHKYKQNNTKE
jgi:hypothetical protein